MQALAVKALVYIGLALAIAGAGFYGGMRWDQPKVDAAVLQAQQDQTAMAQQQAADASEVAAANAKVAAQQAADAASYDRLEAQLVAAQGQEAASQGAVDAAIAAAAAAPSGDARQAPVTDATYDQLRSIIQGMN